MNDNTLEHHGIKGQKWGVRRYQNPDGTLTAAGKKHAEQQDVKWAKKNADKITTYARKASTSELDEYASQLMQATNALNKNGKLSAATVNAYNKKMAEVMTSKVTNITSPNGMTVKFVAKRGEIGVHMALADAGYDMSQLKNGVWSSGRVAYRKDTVNKV